VNDLAWMTRRQRDGGIDRVPLPDDVPGALWLCGKHAIGPDHERAIAETGAHAVVVSLVEEYELIDRYPAYVAWLREHRGHRAVWWPVPDLHAPELEPTVALIDELVTRLRAGETLLMHCAAGIGRTGTMAVCVLVAFGTPLDEALRIVGEARPMAGPEVGTQRELVEAFAARQAG
jgi:protein-tyrosine phosphatase